MAVSARQRLWYLLWLLLCSNEFKPSRYCTTKQTDCRAKSDAFQLPPRRPGPTYCWLIVLVKRCCWEQFPLEWLKRIRSDRNRAVRRTEFVAYPAHRSQLRISWNWRAAALIIANSTLAAPNASAKSIWCRQRSKREEKSKHLCCWPDLYDTSARHYSVCDMLQNDWFYLDWCANSIF